MLEIVFGAALRTLLLAAAVHAALLGARIRQPRLLLAAWTAVLAASLAMPGLQRLAPLSIPPLSYPVPAMLSQNSAEAAAPVTRAPMRPEVAAAVPAPRRAMPPWRWWLSWLYCAVAGALLSRLLLGLVLSWRLLRRSRAAGRAIRISAAIPAPVTIGRVILLPEVSAGWSAAKRTAVLAHEQAHVARGDFYVQLLSQVNRAVFWFSPLAWWLHRRLTALAELASDDAAITALGDRVGYASILLEVARDGLPRAGVAMARPGNVARRIERILAERTLPGVVGRLRPALLAAVVAPLAAVAAISVAGAAPPDPAALDAQRAPHTRVDIDAKLLDAYAGVYRNPTTGSLMEVTREGDHLLTRRGDQPPVPEYAYTDHDFFLTILAAQNSFVTDASGAVLRVVHHEGGRDETLERVGAAEPAAFAQRLAAERAPHVPVSIDPKLLDAYVGAYQLHPRQVFTISRDGDRLIAQLTGQRAYQVYPYSDHDFFYTVVAAQLSFVPGNGGPAAAVVLHQSGRDQTAPRVDVAVAQELDRKRAEERAPHVAISVDPHLLDRYTGRYANDSLELVVTRRGDRLFVQATGYQGVVAYPYTSKDFFATTVPAQVSFVTDGDGKVTQMIRHEFGLDVALERKQ